jgi:hypothetical protein
MFNTNNISVSKFFIQGGSHSFVFCIQTGMSIVESGLSDSFH